MGQQVSTPIPYEHGHLCSSIAGFYFSQPLAGRLGVSTGLEYSYHRLVQDNVPFTTAIQTPDRFDHTYHGLKLPLLLTLDALRTRNRVWRGTVLVGVNLESALLRRSRFVYTTETVTRESGLLRSSKNPDDLTMPGWLGVEGGWMFRENVEAAAGVMAHRRLHDVFNTHLIRDAMFYAKVGYRLPRNNRSQ